MLEIVTSVASFVLRRADRVALIARAFWSAVARDAREPEERQVAGGFKERDQGGILARGARPGKNKNLGLKRS